MASDVELAAIHRTITTMGDNADAEVAQTVQSKALIAPPKLRPFFLLARSAPILIPDLTESRKLSEKT